MLSPMSHSTVEQEKWYFNGLPARIGSTCQSIAYQSLQLMLIAFRKCVAHDAYRMMALTFLDPCLETQTCKIKSIHVSINDTTPWSSTTGSVLSLCTCIVMLQNSHKEGYRPSDCLAFYLIFAALDIKSDTWLNEQRILYLVWMWLIWKEPWHYFCLQTFAATLKRQQKGMGH